MTIKQDQFGNSVKRYSQQIFLFGNILLSFGILLVTVGGSWDITNHLLNKPETFFSPPHALMYSGVAISLFGVALGLIGFRRMEDVKVNFRFPLRLAFLGIALLTGAGPFDFIWHSNFGLDGLLSPAHITLIVGMVFCSLGGMIGISRLLMVKNYQNNFSKYLLVLAILPVWLAGSGLISSLSLPFSNTEFFKFNPDPFTAFVVATIAYPFLISLICITLAKISNFKPGMISLVGGLFLLIYGTTAIVPNFALIESVEFYFLNIIPLIISDIVVSSKKTRNSLLVAGGILGSVFYMVYYPYVMYTFNEFLLGKLVSPSMIYHTYFELMPQVIQITIIPSIVCGIIAVFVSLKFSEKISIKLQ